MVTTRSMSGTTRKRARVSCKNSFDALPPGWTIKPETKKERLLLDAQTRFLEETFCPKYLEKNPVITYPNIEMKRAGIAQWESMTNIEKAPYIAAVKKRDAELMKACRVPKRPRKERKGTNEDSFDTLPPGWTIQPETKKERLLYDAQAHFLEKTFCPKYLEKNPIITYPNIEMKRAGIREWESMTTIEKTPYIDAVKKRYAELMKRRHFHPY